MAFLFCPGRRRRRPKKAIPYEWIYPPPRPQQQPPGPRHPQSQSPLFCKLPLELRLKIFRLALDCSPIPVHTQGLPRFVGLQQPAVGGPQVIVVREARLLSLLITCSRAYAEALPILYSVNTFSVGSRDTVSLLAAASYASWIRRLEFHLRLGKPPINMQRSGQGWIKRRLNRRFTQREESCHREWLKVWEDMRKLEGLRWLHVKIYAVGSWPNRWRDHEMEALMPLRGLLKDEAHGKLTVNWDRPVALGTAAEDMLKEWVIERSVVS
ncbi:uncharacterized protein GGS22DRAFT_195097 [Annulohypoxylon maeteangense]|uniref:uncharacterized protein n=1 Tax=Annulohypoxylon maeteangense TaxID=1927788 RepID=UPI0020079E76|nr:uncharacterized protein GGS22DRAFT_195097 [Annulohypoxylon maeteangense]KAI0883961.1 hypothetical protein GGS22DRAFT_195097 [Annulohypoxylon maeteangense]